jgi:hypothetical protein
MGATEIVENETVLAATKWCATKWCQPADLRDCPDQWRFGRLWRNPTHLLQEGSLAK